MFGPGFARHLASRYRKRGLDRPSRRIVDWLADQGVRGATVLEIGGGVGEIQLELLRRGASHTTNLELSPAYDEQAAALAADAGLTDRMTRRLGDIAVDPGVADTHDFVVLHRVVCCYPDYEALLTAAARHARRGVVFSHPPGTVVAKGLAAVINLAPRLTGREYRFFAHAPSRMRDVLRANGFEPVVVRAGTPWTIAGATPAGGRSSAG